MQRSAVVTGLSVLAMALSACARHGGFKPATNTGKKPGPVKTITPPPAVTVDINSLKYAGALVFEFGTSMTAKPGFLTAGNLKPASRIYVCIDKSGQPVTGQLKFDFAALGIKPYRQTWMDSKTNAVLNSWDLPVATLNYTMSGKIISSPPFAYGEVTFKALLDHPNWVQNFPKDKKVRNTDYDPDLFKVDINPGTLMESKTSYWNVDGTNYYVKVDLLRFVQNPSDGGKPIADCESQKQVTFVKTGL